MLYEIRQNFHYPGSAKIVKIWIQASESCIQDKRSTNSSISQALLNLPEWDLCPEDALQIDMLPNMPLGGGFGNII